MTVEFKHVSHQQPRKGVAKYTGLSNTTPSIDYLENDKVMKQSLWTRDVRVI
jgi:hypothetical protein